MARNNTTTHVEIRFADGEVFGEKHRDSFGGFNNMMNRIAARFDADRVAVHSETSSGIVWTVANRIFTIETVNVL